MLEVALTAFMNATVHLRIPGYCCQFSETLHAFAFQLLALVNIAHQARVRSSFARRFCTRDVRSRKIPC